MNTMYRCALASVTSAVVALGAAMPAAAQMQRNFPPLTLRGTIGFEPFPLIALNGRSATLSPGSRVRDESNRIVLPGSLSGRQFLVNYTVGLNASQVQDVWILRPEEAAISPWPHTLQEARTWTYDSTARTWSRP